MNTIIEQCYSESVKLLKENSTRFGLTASAPSKRAVERKYTAIFGRDSSICALGMIASGDKKLVKTAEKGLAELARHQAKNGQIPNCVEPENKYLNFWVLGCIDATLWWLIALKFHELYAGNKDLSAGLKKNIDKALSWLYCQEQVLDKLLIQPEASDWADIMPRSGKVLYTNSLWCLVKSMYKIPDEKQTLANFYKTFFELDTSSSNIPLCDEKITERLVRKARNSGHYFSFVNFRYWGKDIDVFGNSLAVIANPARSGLNRKIVKYISSRRKNDELPIPVLFDPISDKSCEWKKYMSDHNQNYPYQYHNGGIWPFASCFWAMALAVAGRKKEAESEMEKIARLNERRNWEFNEWFHAKTGRPRGMKKQSWNAGAFLLAYHFIKGDIKI